MATTMDTQGVTLGVGDAASPEVFTTIPLITGFSGPTGSRSEIDTTDLSATAKTFGMGLSDSGTISMSGFYDADDATQEILRAAWAASSAVAKNYVITWTDTSPNSTFSFAAYVSEFSTDTQPDGKVALSVTLRISGAVTKA